MDDDLTRKACEELLAEAQRGASIAEEIGPQGWKKRETKPNKRFVQRTLMSSLSANARQKHSNKPQNSDITVTEVNVFNWTIFKLLKLKKLREKQRTMTSTLVQVAKNDLFHNADTEHNNDTKCK
ncbi:hypothetical protein EB796_011150 [Bugula neritina]|uniref:Uncharacterized protein n=1 Tax=Bugula neritina TaxID=10212 RepID=A0A7J7JVY1_BUGNE|nr:hypothetical protein EB796_011150 [Bugula neritina]